MEENTWFSSQFKNKIGQSFVNLHTHLGLGIDQFLLRHCTAYMLLKIYLNSRVFYFPVILT